MQKLFPIFDKIIEIFDRILELTLKFSLLIAVFFIIYLGVNIYFEKKLSKSKTAFLFIILGLLIIGIVMFNREVIFKIIEFFVPKFKQ